MQSTSCDDVAIALQDEIITESVCLSVFFYYCGKEKKKK